MITYRQLLSHLAVLTTEQLDCDVSVYDAMVGEFYSAESLSMTTETDVLDSGHPVIIINNDGTAIDGMSSDVP